MESLEPITTSDLTKKKRIHYTLELKLQLIRLCINDGERYIQYARKLSSYALLVGY